MKKMQKKKKSTSSKLPHHSPANIKKKKKQATAASPATKRKKSAELESQVQEYSLLVLHYANILKPRLQAYHLTIKVMKFIAIISLFAAAAIVVYKAWPTIKPNNNTNNNNKNGTSKADDNLIKPDPKLSQFANYDTNSDGKITIDELRSLLKSLGYNLSDAELQQLMANTTHNNNNTDDGITSANFDELVSELQKLKTVITPTPLWVYILIMVLSFLLVLVTILVYYRRPNTVTKYICIASFILSGGLAAFSEYNLYGQAIAGWLLIVIGLVWLIISLLLTKMKSMFIDPVTEQLQKAKEKAEEFYEKLTGMKTSVAKKVSDLYHTATDAASAMKSAVVNLPENLVGAAKALPEKSAEGAVALLNTASESLSPPDFKPNAEIPQIPTIDPERRISYSGGGTGHPSLAGVHQYNNTISLEDIINEGGEEEGRGFSGKR